MMVFKLSCKLAMGYAGGGRGGGGGTLEKGQIAKNQILEFRFKYLL